MISKILWIAALIGVLGAFALPAAAGEVVIANNDVGADSIDADVVKSVFLGKTTKVGSAKVTFAVLNGGPTHEAFLGDVVGKTPSQFLSYWRKLAFSGKGTMPQEFDSEEALVAFVKSTPGAIGYVSDATNTEGVTVVAVD